MKKRILSGMRPTGLLHIGHLKGALENWVRLQDEYECFYMVADYHALTTPTDTTAIQRDTLQMVADWIACGIDPERSTIFVQSQAPQHAELAWLLGMITPVSWLERNPTYKEQIALYPDYVNLGLLGYPVLQTADIIIYRAKRVPVGADQLPHLELAREIVRKFNRSFGDTFPEPEPVVSEGARIMGLNRPTDKMSKSFGPPNYIALSDDPETIRQKIARAVTDAGPSAGPISAGTRNLFDLLELFSSPEVVQDFWDRYRKGTIRYVDLKQQVAQDLAGALAPVRERSQALLERPDQLRDVLERGSAHARQIASATVAEARRKMGLWDSSR